MDEALRIRSRYVMLEIPFVSWILLIFPLVLPPIPIGPIAVSFAWNRLDQVELVKRARRFLNRPAKVYGFPAGWIVNFFKNIADILTLGLRSAFAAASLADQVCAKAAGEKRPPKSNLGWLVKWLFLGNVVFLASYIAYPGWVLLRFIRNTEQAIYDQYKMEPIHVEIESENGDTKTVSAYPAYTPEVLMESRTSILGIYYLPLAPTETTEANTLVESVVSQLRNSSDQILQYNIPVYLCNLSHMYPTHYQQVASVIPPGNHYTWYAFSGGRAVCGASSCSEAIAKALGIPARVRAVGNMVVGTDTGDIKVVLEKSYQQPVACFIQPPSFGPAELAKNASPAFLQAVSSSNASVFFLPYTKKESLGSQLKAQDILFKGCAVIHRGQVLSRIKMGWTTSLAEDLIKIAKELSTFDTQHALVLSKDTPHVYKSLPCYIYGQWEQVVRASALQPVVLACGPGMNTERAETTFLRRVGSLFFERGFQLAVAPIEKDDGAGSIGESLRAAGLKEAGCYVVHKGRITATISKTVPQTALEDFWVPDAAKYLAQGA